MPGRPVNINETAAKIHRTAKQHGFWNKERNFGEMLMLVTSELAEALEEDRAGRPLVWAKCTECGESRMFSNWPEGPNGWLCHGLPLKPEGAAVELADALIRILDMMHSTKVDIEEVIRIKMNYNDTREHMHGKSY